MLVVGAGAMGAFTALAAREAGHAVTLLDAWGAGHPRSTSGDETRTLRSAHGDEALYTRWSRQSLELWRRREQEWGLELIVPTGALWFAGRDGGFEDASVATLVAEGIPHERLDAAAVLERWPQIGADGLRFALWEPEACTLMARRGVQAAVAAFQRAGGRYALAGVRPGRAAGGRLLEVTDTGGRAWAAGAFVFACGPWLPLLFPDVLGDLVRVTKQDVLFVGPPAGDDRFRAGRLPAWVDYDAAFYGHPAIDERGAKIAPDRVGPPFDPTGGERIVDPESARLARGYLRQRFPALAGGPVVETRVCQYESTPDTGFAIDRHPALENVWLAGGGSGHAFKHGPRIGEYVTARLAGAPPTSEDAEAATRFRLGPRDEAPGLRTGGDSPGATFESQ